MLKKSVKILSTFCGLLRIYELYLNKKLRTVLHLTKAEEIWAFYFGPLGDLFTEFCFNFFLGFAPGPLGNCEDVNECVEYGHQCAFRCHNIPGKVEKILKGSLVSIPSPSMKIQIIGRKVCFS